jgi:hypothetical protein
LDTREEGTVMAVTDSTNPVTEKFYCDVHDSWASALGCPFCAYEDDPNGFVPPRS